jgi:hypothetical protein
VFLRGDLIFLSYTSGSFNVLMPPLLLVTLLVQSNLEGIGLFRAAIISLLGVSSYWLALSASLVAGVGDMQSLLFALLILGKSFFNREFFPEFFSELFYF